jgi:hypothetical protein
MIPFTFSNESDAFYERLSDGKYFIVSELDIAAAKENPDMEIAVYATKSVNHSWGLDAYGEKLLKKWEELSNPKLWIIAFKQ